MINKTKKRILFCISKENEIKACVSYAKAIKKYFSDVQTCAIYTKDIKKYEFFQSELNSFSMTINEYRDLEDQVYANIKEQLIGKFDKVYSLRGDRIEVITEEMKAYDLLVIVKDKGSLTPLLTKIVKTFYKPIVILHEDEVDYDFSNILMLNDGGYMVNRSVFSYFHLFGEKKIDVLRVNVEDKDRLSERFGDVCNVIDEKGEDVVSIINSYIPKYDMILMGGLNYPIFIERLTGQTGLKIIETAIKPIFIG